MTLRAAQCGSMTFGQTLRALRESQGMSRRELEDLTGVSQRQIEYLEADAAQPRTGTLDRLVKCLGPELLQAAFPDVSIIGRDPVTPGWLNPLEWLRPSVLEHPLPAA